MSSTIGVQCAVASVKENTGPREALIQQYLRVRDATEALCSPLVIEDYGLQGMPNTSPLRWHLAHTTWFFETFLLKPYLSHYIVFHPQFEHLFNSYYETVGSPFPRSRRGLLSRPTTDEVYAYRAHVNAAMEKLIESVGEGDWLEVSSRITLGCHHEEQHQELMLMDIKYNFSLNPLRPAYRSELPQSFLKEALPLNWIAYPAGLYQMGHAGEGFAFDNEGPCHGVYLAPYMLASRLVTNGEYLEFIAAGGYQRAELWLADGWHTVQEQHWQAPLYWDQSDGDWQQFTLGGMRRILETAPVCHVSYYEADAYARFRGKRLPTEQEWEVAATAQSTAGNFREADFLHPQPATPGAGLLQMFGDVWEWTGSAYAPYPCYRPSAGALGEYNGKFMANQMVLRGGSCVTSHGHVRATYRNFFYPSDRWQFSGIRLADNP